MSDVQWMQWLWLELTIGGVALGGYLLMKFFRYEVRRLAQRAVKNQMLDPATLEWIEEISRGVRLAVLALVALLMVFFPLRVLGHPAVQGWNPARLLEWLMDRGVRVIFLLAGAYLAMKVVHIFVSKVGVLIRATDDSPAAELEREMAGFPGMAKIEVRIESILQDNALDYEGAARITSGIRFENPDLDAARIEHGRRVLAALAEGE